jgi:transposase
MRGEDEKQRGLYSYVTLEQRVPADHPLRKIRPMMDRALEQLDKELEALYARRGRPSIAPERLLRSLLLQILYSVRSERQLMEQLDYNLLFRWFVGLEMDDRVWDVTVFTKNRERLISGEVSQHLLAAVVEQAREQNLLSEEHFTVDGTLLQAWAAARSFVAKDDIPKPGQGSGSGGAVLLRDQVKSKTDPESRLYKKAAADKSVPSYLGHALMENRNGLVVAAAVSLAATHAEREVALQMIDGLLRSKPAKQKPGYTVGGDKQYQEQQFISGLRERAVAPHIAEYEAGAAMGKNSLSEQERADPRRSISQQKRKLIERVFAWAKLDRPLRQVKFRGLKRVDWFYRLAITAYNLVRMRKLMTVPA